MMEEWAREVPDDATVVHLGDLSYRANGMFKNVISKHLTGERKLLIRGNHDRQRFSFYRDSNFKLTRPMELYFRQEGGTEPCLEQVTYKRAQWVVSLNHYPWSVERDGEQPANHIRIHGHIHNSGYSRAVYVPFLRNHINISVEQTKYRPVNLLALLEGYLLGVVPADDAEREEAAARKAARMGSTDDPD
jgi:calcineurin-like phosphoesterase family protein